MVRKPVTYARKKKNNLRHVDPRTQSSPIRAINDPEEEISLSEMSRRIQKRSRQSWGVDGASGLQIDNCAGRALKKLKLDKNHASRSPQGTLSPITQTRRKELRTPYNSSLTQQQVFELEPSKGNNFSKTDSSPVPFASSIVSSNKRPGRTHNYGRGKFPSQRTSSSNLKENAISPLPRSPPNPATKKENIKTFRPSSSAFFAHMGTLASPFTSKPSSPISSANAHSAHASRAQASAINGKRALSDAHFNANLPSYCSQPQNQTQSATASPARPYDDESLKARRPSAPSATIQRPDAWFSSHTSTARLSDQIISSSVDFFFPGAFNRHIVVDFNRPPSQLSCNMDYDEAFFNEALEVSTPFKQRSTAQDKIQDLTTSTSENPRLQPLSLDSGFFDSWQSDSIISPPKPSDRTAYNQDSEGHDSALTLKSPLIDAPSSKNLDPLQGLFNRLDLGIDHGISLDIEVDTRPSLHLCPSETRDASVEPVNGRKRRGTIRASDLSASSLEGPRRTRSGTVVQGSIRPRRERSDTVVARPGADCIYGPDSSACPVDVEMADGTKCLNAEVLTASAITLGKTEQQDDELLLKGQWIDEEWAVAAPPSPILPRRKEKVITQWRKRFELKKATGIWGSGHDPDDGEDDPLLLK
ncbi:hypothetical protein H0H93_000914 [Arthromyces matolae]|nr:hypothetical protein H0H93_000914 [Arthromyces matolae]